jgi:hypothetical protein
VIPINSHLLHFKRPVKVFEDGYYYLQRTGRNVSLKKVGSRNELPYDVKYGDRQNPQVQIASGRIDSSIKLSCFLRMHKDINWFKPSFEREQPFLFTSLNDACRRETKHWLQALNDLRRVLRLYPYERNKQDYPQRIKNYQRYLEFIEELLIQLQGFRTIDGIVANSSRIGEFQVLINNFRPIQYNYDQPDRLPSYSNYFLDCLSAYLDLCEKYCQNLRTKSLAA